MKQPNILLIMVDDMGYSDLGCCGGDIETPHLDGLAAKGILHTQFYNTARCCPARAALLTGLYPHQAGMGWMTAANLGTPGYTGDLSPDCATIAECLKPAGYRSYAAGKWHVTHEDSTGPEGPKHSWPCQRGFDRFYGTIKGGGCYYNPPTLTLDNDPVEREEGFYYTDAITEHACRFIAEHQAAPEPGPFFLYTAYTAPHWPLHAHPEDIDHYRGRYREGWDVLRERKFQRMRDLGLLDPFWNLSGRDEKVPAWDTLSPEEQDEFDLRMAIYAAQVTCMDRGVGRILDQLKEHDLFDNTLILFLSDNGGSAEEIHRRDPNPATWGTEASYQSYGRGWANVSNTPFRLFKCWVHEGGISTPLIAHWPEGITGDGVINSGPGHITDILPTCLEVAQASYPPESRPTAPPLAGTSLVPGFSGRERERGPMLWEHQGNRALRKGPWKLVAKGLEGPWELYNMESDRSELLNLADQHPDLVEELAQEWDRIASETQVYPLDGRGWGERLTNPIPPSS